MQLHMNISTNNTLEQHKQNIGTKTNTITMQENLWKLCTGSHLTGSFPLLP